MSDNLEQGRTFGTEPKEWFVKEVTGVLLTMELERLVAVLGLAYKLPYVPNNNARREQDLLHLAMIDNAFCFGTTMMSKSGEFYIGFFMFIALLRHAFTEYNNHTRPSSKLAPKGKSKRDIFAPASPALSGRVSTSGATSRKSSLRASDTGAIFFILIISHSSV